MNIEKLNKIKSKIKNEVSILRFVLVAIIVISIFNYQSISDIKNNEKIIIKTLNQSSKFWVSSKNASNEYLTDFGLYAVQLQENITPANVDHNFAKLLEIINPKNYPEIRLKLKNKAKMIKKYNRNAYSFRATKTNINKKNKQIFITGLLTRWTDTGNKQPKKFKITIDYKIENALFSIININKELL
jgi:type IV conjugative transfer system protein TraE